MKIAGMQKVTLLDFPDTLSCIIFTKGCNFKCPFCQNSGLINNLDDDTLEMDKVFSYLEKRKGILEGVVITGGEPTIQKDLKDFIRKVKDLGLSVKLDTNGSNPEVIKELLDEHLIDYIAMDIKTVFSKYSEVANRNVDIDSLRSSIELIKNSNIDYEFRTTVVKAFVSYEDLVFILDYLNCKKYYLQKFEDRQSNIVYHLEAYSDDELKEIYSKLKEKYDFIKIRGLR